MRKRRPPPPPQQDPATIGSASRAPDPTAVRRKFKLHPAILWDIIQRQAGTLSRATLEGVMNAIDARATEVIITCTGDRLTIEDNGTGFGDRQEIERCFETFGQPHAPDEQKRFGAFRMGRGQLFAFGRNVWRSGQWRMDVDLKEQAQDQRREEIEYDLKEQDTIAPGCRIEIDLYHPVLPSDLARLETDIQRAVRYLETPVRLNGKRVSIDPATLTWDITTDDAYIRLRESGQLSLYNLGVHVKDIEDSRFGTGGLVVSRKQLLVNFARNEVLGTCPVWRRIAHVVDQRAKARRRPVELTDAERRNIVRDLVAGTYEGGDAHKLKLLRDVRGDWWSVESLERFVKQRALRSITVAPAFSSSADDLMEQSVALVLGEGALDLFGVDSIPELMAILAKANCGQRLAALEAVPLDVAVARLPKVGRIVPDTEWTRTERMMMPLLESAQWAFVGRGESPKRRTLRLGAGQQGADAWTDGTTYIAIHRRLLGVSGHIRDWHRIGAILLHEYCHGDSTAETHVHGVAFYRSYHERQRDIGEFVAQCVYEYPRALERANLALKKDVLRLQDYAAKTARAESTHDELLRHVEALTPPPPPPEPRVRPRRPHL